MNEEVIRVWQEATGSWIKEGYGQTETTLIAGTFKGSNFIFKTFFEKHWHLVCIPYIFTSGFESTLELEF